MSASPEPETFAAALADLRRRRGLTRCRLAALAGVDHGYVLRLEAGRRLNPRRTIVDRLAEGLDAAPAERDRLLLAAGFAPADPLWALADVPEARALAEALRHPAIDRIERENIRRLARVLAVQARQAVRDGIAAGRMTT